jgi:conjugal transfer mating pair stabilization protein TraG
MATVEVFTIGGGDYLVNTFNAVAAWTGSGGYASMLQVVFVMAFAMSVIVVAFNQDWRAWLSWFLQATLMYMCLMVPRTDVHVTDRINPSLQGAQVANVPLGLGLMASFTSQIGDYLVRTSELVFGLPADLNYSANGMIYGSRLLQATQGLSISDPEFAANIDAHYRQCVFYDILLGHKSMSTLASADDLWTAIGPGSPARSQPYLTRDDGGQVTSTIKTCLEAYQALSGQWASITDGMIVVMGKQLYPGMSDTLAKAKFYADLPTAYTYIAGVSKNAGDLMKQTLSINAMTQAMHTMQGTAGGSAVDVYAQTRAEIQTRNTYSAIAHNAMEWVPILNIVLTVVFYALFPIIFPLFLMPKSGPAALKGYITGFFYLCAWAPIYVILNMIVTLQEHTELFGGGTIALVSFGNIAAVNSNTAVLAGYLIASVPFIAAGMARGAMAISGQATSFLAPSQSAAEEAAREASTGNISLGNTTMDNFSYNGRQGNAWTDAPSYQTGFGQIATRDLFGGQQTSFEGGTSATDMHSAISTLPIGAQLTSSFNTDVERVASETTTRGDRIADQARDSLASSVSHFTELRKGFQSSNGVDRGYGTNDQSAMSNGFAETDSAAADLRQQYGLSDQASHDLTTAKYLGGSVGASASKFGISGSLSGGLDHRWTDGDRETTSKQADKIESYLENRSRDHRWSESSEAFTKASVNTSESSLASQAQGMSSSLTKAKSFDREASHYYEAARQLSARHSMREGDGVAISQNLSNDWIAFASQEMDRNPVVYPVGHRFDPRREPDYTDADPGIARQREILLQKFMESRSRDLRAEVDAYLKAPEHSDIAGPMLSSAAGVQQVKLPTGAGGSGLPQSTFDIGGAVRQRQQEARSGREAGSDAITQTGRIAKEGASDLDGSLDEVHDHTKSHFSRLPLSPLMR